MPKVDRLKKINYQYRKPSINTIHSTWPSINYIGAAQSQLNAQVPNDTTTLDDSLFPTVFLETNLDWEAGVLGDATVKIRKDDVYVVQDLTHENLDKHEFVTTPNLGIAYFNRSYYGGIL